MLVAQWEFLLYLEHLPFPEAHAGLLPFCRLCCLRATGQTGFLARPGVEEVHGAGQAAVGGQRCPFGAERPRRARHRAVVPSRAEKAFEQQKIPVSFSCAKQFAVEMNGCVSSLNTLQYLCRKSVKCILLQNIP